MLDKDDISIVRGVIDRKIVLLEIGETKLDLHLRNGYDYPYLGRYILVEHEKGLDYEVTPEEKNKITRERKIKKEEYKKRILIEKGIDCVKILEGKRGTYFANKTGEFFIKYKKSGNIKYLTKYENRAHKTVDITIAQKTYVAKNLIAKLFVRGYKDGDIVVQKNDDPFDCSLENLKVIPKSEYAKETYGLIGAQPVGLFEDGKLVKQWKSARKAAKDLFCSYQTVMDTCNGKWKTKLFDVRWI
jgi:hypothetical protein